MEVLKTNCSSSNNFDYVVPFFVLKKTTNVGFMLIDF